MWLKNKKFQRLGGGWLERSSLRLWSKMQMSALHARKDPEVVKLLAEVQKEERTLLSAWEQYFIYSLARAQAGFKNATMAEVGVYRAGSARLICAVKGDMLLYLFDTFEGLPESTKEDHSVHRKNQYAYSIEQVQAYLREFPNISYFKGIFPESSVGVPEQKYCFVHFDVDLYAGTKACLEYFYPRMLPAGVMLSHDYGLLAGVEQAFTEFFADKPENVIELPSTQCMVIKQ